MFPRRCLLNNYPTAGLGEPCRTGTTTTWVRGQASTAPPCSMATSGTAQTPLTTQPSPSRSHKGYSLVMTLHRLADI